MAFGTGSAMAHRAVDGLMGPRTVTHEHVTSDGQTLAPNTSPQVATVGTTNACVNQAKAFQDVHNFSLFLSLSHTHLFSSFL